MEIIIFILVIVVLIIINVFVVIEKERVREKLSEVEKTSEIYEWIALKLESILNKSKVDYKTLLEKSNKLQNLLLSYPEINIEEIDKFFQKEIKKMKKENKFIKKEIWNIQEDKEKE